MTGLTDTDTGPEERGDLRDLLFTFSLKFPKVKIYEGSFTEWTTYPDNPVVTGKNPR